MPSLPFLDTNVFVRHIVGDEPDHTERAAALFSRIERGELDVRTADTVIFETVFVLESFYRATRDHIHENLLPLLEMPGIDLPGKASFREVFGLFLEHRSLSFADCYHAVLMRRLHLEEIISFDRGFDRLPDIRRIEPS